MACRQITSCKPPVCSDITTRIPQPDLADVKYCLQARYKRVGSNLCDQFKRLSGCGGDASLWGRCGDVRPDEIACPSRRIPHTFEGGVRGLICARNRPDPTLVCPRNGFSKTPYYCK